MAQILDPLPTNNKNVILCCYLNATSSIQIARITNIANWYFERVVFPGQRLVFEALPEAKLEIHSGMMASAILSDTIPCSHLEMGADDVAAEPLQSSTKNQPLVIKVNNKNLVSSQVLEFAGTR
ncbi:MAG: DUF1830 domain-containing protein [Coleofasciculaceae cyanobacterium]